MVVQEFSDGPHTPHVKVTLVTQTSGKNISAKQEQERLGCKASLKR